jgi:arylsulfatase A-like enzyme
MQNKPNIIYILADDMGFGDMGCNNPDSKIPTPNLDRLARQGMRFTDAHAPSSVCTPSRYSLLTGQYCWRTKLKQGVLWPWDPALVETDRLTVAKLLRRNGYRTACIGKWHLGWNWPTLDGQPANKGVQCGVWDQTIRNELGANIDYSQPIHGGPIDCGFDYYFGDDVPNFPPYTWIENNQVVEIPSEKKPSDMYGHPGAMAPGWQLDEVMPELTRRSVEYIENVTNEPFFLYVALTAPHTPIVPAKEFKGKSDAGAYGDYVYQVDWCVGQVLAALQRRNIEDNTIVIFTSDNGPEPRPSNEYMGAYNQVRQFRHYSMGHLRGAKLDTWEGGHRVPFLVRWPEGTAKGMECNQLILLNDLLATCADLLGVKLPEGEGQDSISMLPLLQGKTDMAVREFAVHQSCSGKFAIRKGDWVFIDAPSGDDSNSEPQWFKRERGYTSHNFEGELFNLSEDIAERVNCYGDRPEVVSELSELLESVTGGGHRCPPKKRHSIESE